MTIESASRADGRKESIGGGIPTLTWFGEKKKANGDQAYRNDSLYILAFSIWQQLSLLVFIA